MGAGVRGARRRDLASDGTCNRWEGADGRREFAMTHSYAPDNHNPCDGFAAAAIYEDDLIRLAKSSSDLRCLAFS